MKRKNIKLLIVLCSSFVCGTVVSHDTMAQPTSGSWTIRSYEPQQDTLLRWYGIDRENFLFADTALGFAYWQYNDKDTLRGSGGGAQPMREPHGISLM